MNEVETQIKETRFDLEKQIILSESRLMQHIKDVDTRLTLRLGAIMVTSITAMTAVLHFFH